MCHQQVRQIRRRRKMAKFTVPQEMKSFWGEFWCGPEEIPQAEWTQIAQYQRHGHDETAAEVWALVVGDDVTYDVVAGRNNGIRTVAAVRAAEFARWLRFGEIEFVER
jgi:hypothetical protein